MSKAVVARLERVFGAERRLADRTEAWLAAKFRSASRRLRTRGYA